MELLKFIWSHLPSSLVTAPASYFPSLPGGESQAWAHAVGTTADLTLSMGALAPPGSQKKGWAVGMTSVLHDPKMQKIGRKRKIIPPSLLFPKFYSTGCTAISLQI